MIDSKAIAARIRGLIGGLDRADIEAVALELRVSEVALRMTIDPGEPHPTVEVMAAVAAHYGVDPVWLLCGEYHSARHMASIAEEGAPARMEMARMIARRLGTETPAAGIRELRLEA